MIENRKTEELLSFVYWVDKERELKQEVRRFETSIKILNDEAKEAEDRGLVKWAKVLYAELESYQVGKIKTELEINKIQRKILEFQLKEMQED